MFRRQAAVDKKSGEQPRTNGSLVLTRVWCMTAPYSQRGSTGDTKSMPSSMPAYQNFKYSFATKKQVVGLKSRFELAGGHFGKVLNLPSAAGRCRHAANGNANFYTILAFLMKLIFNRNKAIFQGHISLVSVRFRE